MMNGVVVPRMAQGLGWVRYWRGVVGGLEQPCGAVRCAVVSVQHHIWGHCVRGAYAKHIVMRCSNHL